jgi:hypothetical protein
MMKWVFFRLRYSNFADEDDMYATRRNFSLYVQPAQVILIIDPASFKELRALGATQSDYSVRRIIAGG